MELLVMQASQTWELMNMFSKFKTTAINIYDNMKTLIISISIVAVILISCKSKNDNTNNMDKNNNTKEINMSFDDNSPKVTGIGGIFFYSKNPQKTKDWYTKNLGIEINEWGSASFETRNFDRPEETSSIQWKPFKNGDEYFSPSNKDFMINYKVQNIEGLISKLKKNGVTILDSIATYDYGKFVHIMDDEGNKIELWEPNETN